MDIPEHSTSAEGVAIGYAKDTRDPGMVEQSNGDEKHSQPCQHELELRTLHTDLDSMRQLITCNICQRFMYEPYALPCGHTYCYSCLAEWMGKNHKKTCPDCRTYVKQEPTPAFLIREMVQIFVNRTQLLPDGETSEEHHQMAREEADIISKDRADTDERQGGLFKGTFSRPSVRTVIAVHDTSDHVDRCPNCLHEVEDGWCLICHVRVRASDADSDYDESDDSFDSEVGDGQRTQGMFGGPWDVEGPQVYDWSSEEEEDSEAEDDDEHDLTGFVEEQVRWESDADVPDYSFEEVDFNDMPHGQRAAPVSDVSDSEEDSDVVARVQPVRRRLVNRASGPSTRAQVTISSDDESSDEEDAPPLRHAGRRRTRYIDADTDDEEGSGAEPTEDEIADARPATAGFSPPQYDSDTTTRPASGNYSSPPGLPLFDVLVDPVDPSEEGSSSSGEESETSGDHEISERSDDDEGSDESAESASDEDSDGSESMASGWDLHPFGALLPFTDIFRRYSD